MRNPFLILLISFFSNVGFAQIQPSMLSIKGYGGDGIDQFVKPVMKEKNGSFILTLGTYSHAGSGNLDLFCQSDDYRNIYFEYDSSGSQIQWTRCYSFTGDTGLIYLFPFSNGDIVLGGFYRTNGYGLYVARHDAQDNIIWSRSFSKGNGGILRNMIQTSDGGYLLVSESYNTDTNVAIHYGNWQYSDIWLLKLDSMGNKVWSTVIGGSDDDKAKKVFEINDAYYIVGTTASNDYDVTGQHGVVDIFVVRLESNGNIVWTKCYGGSNGENADDAYIDDKGNILIAGGTRSNDGDVTNKISPSTADGDVWVICVDTFGNLQWEKCYGGPGEEYARSVCRGTDGKVWVAGMSGTAGGQVYCTYDNGQLGDAFIVQADSIGNFLSSKVLGSTLGDDALIIHPLASGGVIVGGYYGKNDGAFSSLPAYGSNSAFLVKFFPWTTGLKNIHDSRAIIEIFPNPASKEVRLKASEECEIKITDITGKLFYESKLDGVTDINVSRWAYGVYLIEATNNEGRKQMYKIIVQ